MTRRTRILSVILGLIIVVASANALHIHQLETELGLVATQRIDTFLGDIPVEEQAEYQFASTVTASKTYLVLGAVQGKISVYMRHEAKDPDKVSGFEYFLEREAKDTWKQVESGRCTSEHCTVEGLKVLRALEQ